MKVRCYNHNGIEWLRYGGRGISVCGRWLNNFENFLADMGEKPSPRHSLDRIDNDGNYEPNNCRWATRKQQANNKSSNRLLTFKGETLSLSAWSDKLKIHPSTLFKHKGLTPDEALAKIYDKHIMKQNKKWNKQV